MTTPQDKANELFEKFGTIPTGMMAFEKREYAIMHVEGILELLDRIRKLEYTTFWTEKENKKTWEGIEEQEYWQSVLTSLKQEKG